jgi:predicted Zn finger-like uncharacterized protein
MLKVKCEACGAPYEVDPRRVPASGMKMRCPSCGASFHVSAQGSAAAFDLDLPAPKATDRGRAGRPVAPVFGEEASSEFADLPAPKGAAQSLPENLADDLADTAAGGSAFDLDLPAPKTFDARGARPAAGGGAPRPGRIAPDFAPPAPADLASFDLDLPAPKGAPRAPLPAVKAAPAEKNTGADFDLDLPAPKAGAGGFIPAKRPSPRQP